MGSVTNILAPTRFLTLLGHFIACILAFYTKVSGSIHLFFVEYRLNVCRGINCDENMDGMYREERREKEGGRCDPNRSPCGHLSISLRVFVCMYSLNTYVKDVWVFWLRV